LRRRLIKVKYDFDKVIDRSDTNSSKWAVETMFGDPDLLPLWIADMDFPSPQPVVEALKKRAEHPVYGYTLTSKSLIEAIVHRMETKYRWQVRPEWIILTPGVVPAINAGVRAVAGPSDNIIIQSPVYPPFWSSVTNNQCLIGNNQLLCVDGRYEMDFHDLEKQFEEKKAKAIILCSPHNPVGRVWTQDELARLGKIVISHGGIVISDEIHSELVLNGHRHIPFASISKEFEDNSITCLAPSKTFNIAGLHASVAIIPNDNLRSKFNKVRSGIMGSPGLFGLTAMEAAFRDGDDWLRQVLEYISENQEFVLNFLRDRLPMLKCTPSEGTYLMWIDFRSLKMDPEDLSAFLRQKAKVGLNDGYTFGPGGEGFMRMNIGCPRSILKEALERIEKAVNLLK
jgi:cystathionine beta-lyase